MARIDYLDAEDLPPGDRDLLARPINVFRAVAHRPEALRGLAGIGEWVRWRSALDGRVRELVILTVGLSAGSRYEVAHHVKIAGDFGASEDDLDRLFAWFEGGPPLEGVAGIAVSAARELSERAALSDRSWETLIAALGREDAIDVLMTASYYAMVVRMLASFAVDNEEDFEPYARRFDELARRARGQGPHREAGEER